MESVVAAPTRRRAATTWADASGNANKVHVNGDSLQARAALEFAEKRQYRELLRAIQLRPELAAESDGFGMTPLHWICTDRDVPLRAVQALVLAYPKATTVRNLAGLLPIHVAIGKDLSLDAFKTILKFYPKAIVAETPKHQTSVQLAQLHVTSPAALRFLKELEQEVRALGRVPPAASSSASHANHKTRSHSSRSMKNPEDPEPTVVRGWEDGYPVAIVESSSAAQQQSADDTATTRPLPPVWKLSTSCYVCHIKFGYFKKRHHCRNCGESVCGSHSKHSLPLKHLGLFQAQRVCSGCYGRLQSHYTSRAIARLNPHTSSARHAEDDDVMQHDFVQSPVRPGRQNRSRSAYTMTFSQHAQQHPLLSPRLHQGVTTPTPLVLNSPPSTTSTRTTRSATMSPRTASTNSIRSGGSTDTTAAKPNPKLISISSGLSKHTAQAQHSDDDQSTVLDRQREMQRRRDRLAHTDLETYAWHGRDSETACPQNDSSQGHADEDNELRLEMQMDKLALAKKQIRDALQRSKRDMDEAQAKKRTYDALAKEFEKRGYAHSPGKDLDGVDRTFVDSESGVDEVASPASSTAAAKYGYISHADNQHDHDLDVASVIVHAGIMSNVFDDDESDGDEYVGDDDDDDESAVYGLVPETTPSDPVRKPALPVFGRETLDVPLDLAGTYYDLGVVLLTKNDFDGAAEELQRSLDVDPSNAQTWYHFAKALEGKGESDEAEKAIQQSLAIEPNSLPSLSLLGKLLNARGEHDEAIVVFRRALNLQSPSDSLLAVEE